MGRGLRVLPRDLFWKSTQKMLFLEVMRACFSIVVRSFLVLIVDIGSLDLSGLADP